MKHTSAAPNKKPRKRKADPRKPVNAPECIDEETRHLTVVEMIAGLLDEGMTEQLAKNFRQWLAKMNSQNKDGQLKLGIAILAI